MKNSFFAIYNQSGIACASDTDNTVYRLSQEEPIAIAVCPYSPIPWNSIIRKYQRKGEPQHHSTLEGYARDFESFLKEFPADKAWNNLGIDELNLIFLGFGEEEVYPSVCDIQIEVDEETGRMKFGEIHNSQIAIKNPVSFCWIGDWDCLSSILHGATRQVKHFAVRKELQVYETYKNRVIERFTGTEYEEYVKDSFDRFDKDCLIYNTVQKANKEINRDIRYGMVTFNIEEMVSATEDLINAKLRLTHLRNGGQGLVGSIKEIAVITRTEGITWIKHSLFAI